MNPDTADERTTIERIRDTIADRIASLVRDVEFYGRQIMRHDTTRDGRLEYARMINTTHDQIVILKTLLDDIRTMD